MTASKQDHLKDEWQSKHCATCGVNFIILDWELDFYAKIDVPGPKLCPDCRQQKRAAQINQLKLFKRKCDATGKNMISNYIQSSSYRVYLQDYWFSDRFDAIEYGRDFDFNRPFFQQYHELDLAVPRPNLCVTYGSGENSDYTNYSGHNKNSYLVFNTNKSEDCYYCYGVQYSKDSLDCYRGNEIELCYEVLDSDHLYACNYVKDSRDCIDCCFLKNCYGCKNCFFCSNISQKTNWAFNQPATLEEIENLKASCRSRTKLKELKKSFQEFCLQFPQKYMHGIGNENSTGNYLLHCKNATSCYDSGNLQDTKYCYQMFFDAKDCLDCQECGGGELMYECANLGEDAYNLRFCIHSETNVSDLTYCNWCVSGCSNLFGCVGLKKKEYCIFNKEYSKRDYQELRTKIIHQMKETEEWGEFFPAYTSPFPYNHTIANLFYPIKKEQALSLGYSWDDSEEVITLDLENKIVPDSMSELREDSWQNIYSCTDCKKAFKHIVQELEFYRKQNIPPPDNCFNCRHLVRFSQRNRRKLILRNCDSCGIEFTSTYSKDRIEKIYCETCFQNCLV